MFTGKKSLEILRPLEKRFLKIGVYRSINGGESINGRC